MTVRRARNVELITTAQAAAAYGCTRQNLAWAMRRNGFAPVVEHMFSTSGMPIVRHWWNPDEVFRAKRTVLQRKQVRNHNNLRRWNAKPRHLRVAIVKASRLKSLRTYYQAKAAARNPA